MTEDSGARELLAEFNRIHTRYVRRQRNKAILRAVWVALSYSIIFALLGNLVGDAVQDHDWAHVAMGSVALALLMALYWRTVFRRD